MQDKFFGLKLNSILLLVLIILMVVAIKIMLRNEKEYFGIFQKSAQVEKPIVDTRMLPIPKENILGNKEDLISFSIWPNTKVHGGIVSFRGIIKGGYFNEGSLGIRILNPKKEVLKSSYGVTKSDWMTGDPLPFEGNIDFTGIPKGSVYFEIKNDNPSDLRQYNKSILIPIIIE